MARIQSILSVATVLAMALPSLAAPAQAWGLAPLVDPSSPTAPAFVVHGSPTSAAPSDHFIDMLTGVVYQRTSAGLVPVGESLPPLGYVTARAYNSDRCGGCPSPPPGAVCHEDVCMDWHVAVTGTHEVVVKLWVKAPPVAGYYWPFERTIVYPKDRDGVEDLGNGCARTPAPPPVVKGDLLALGALGSEAKGVESPIFRCSTAPEQYTTFRDDKVSMVWGCQPHSPIGYNWDIMRRGLAKVDVYVDGALAAHGESEYVPFTMC